MTIGSYLLDEDQFSGRLGSSALSNSTVYLSGSESGGGIGLPAPSDSFSCISIGSQKVVTKRLVGKLCSGALQTAFPGLGH